MTQPNNHKRFKSRVLRVLFHILPRRIKRLVFISSLSGKVCGSIEMDRVTRLRLQQVFGLCTDPDAVALPLAYNDRIWSNRPIEQLVCPMHLQGIHSDQELTRTARQIVVMMPCWLVYGKTMKIVDDVRELLIKRNELFSVS
jgi:hypothetical protein